MLGLHTKSTTESAFEAFSTSKLAQKGPIVGMLRQNQKKSLELLQNIASSRYAALYCSFATLAPGRGVNFTSAMVSFQRGDHCLSLTIWQDVLLG
jgi:hypothetical protein